MRAAVRSLEDAFPHKARIERGIACGIDFEVGWLRTSRTRDVEQCPVASVIRRLVDTVALRRRWSGNRRLGRGGGSAAGQRDVDHFAASGSRWVRHDVVNGGETKNVAPY